MTNFWGNSSSQYIAKKIIRPDFFATPGERVLLWLTFAYLVFWSCFGKAPIWCTKAYQNVTWFAAIFEAKRPKLHRTSRTTPHTVTFGATPMIKQCAIAAILEAKRPKLHRPSRTIHIMWPSVSPLWLNSVPKLWRNFTNFLKLWGTQHTVTFAAIPGAKRLKLFYIKKTLWHFGKHPIHNFFWTSMYINSHRYSHVICFIFWNTV